MNFPAILILFFLEKTIAYGQTRISNGKNASYCQFPYQALINNRRGYCGGSIIHKHWILTAGHCKILFEDGSRVVVIVGTIKRSGRNGVLYRTSAFILHENYATSNYKIDNDIGLIRLGGKIKFNNSIKPVKLPKTNLKNNETLLAVISGWGSTRISSGDYRWSTKTLQYARVNVVDNQECYKAWKNELSNQHICTSIDAGKSACIGDSGGPVVINDTQVGIISFGDYYCGYKLPNVHTRVFSYVPWIKNKVKLYGDTIEEM